MGYTFKVESPEETAERTGEIDAEILRRFLAGSPGGAVLKARRAYHVDIRHAIAHVKAVVAEDWFAPVKAQRLT